MNVIDMKPFTAADFASDQEVRWCPGCGDYAILKAVKTVLADVGRSPDEVVFVSGIGCAARFPYYLSSYGFHTIHGRAPAVATGVKLANPDLDVWVVGGDGDFLSIGGNHLIHVLRRNVDLNLLLFNNAIYGLTKGQYSPTSPVGTRSPSTPGGSVEQPVNAALLALGAGAKFVARGADTLQTHLPQVLRRAHDNKGASFVEILQNCIVYNDGAFGAINDRSESHNATIRLEHGKPMIFGKDEDRGLVWDGASEAFRVVDLAQSSVSELAIHDETNFARAVALARLEQPDFPVALGVLYDVEAPAYCDAAGFREAAGRARGLDRSTLQAMLDG
ncbi:MAG: 2-oxoacid:ferredoxin oxidoreductase subunit beta [Alphaproteobacteria bacterium]|nr:MAG: 2-oxoacid:ferredoxin oxidoreductase subunit beta [Alphaproteobacteria bacterium]